MGNKYSKPWSFFFHNLYFLDELFERAEINSDMYHILVYSEQ